MLFQHGCDILEQRYWWSEHSHGTRCNSLAQVPLGSRLEYVPLLVGNFHTENIWRGHMEKQEMEVEWKVEWKLETETGNGKWKWKLETEIKKWLVS